MELISTHPIKESDLGFNRTLFGGKLLYWLDGDAVAYAMQYCDTPKMVTVSIDKCIFQKPGRPGHLIKIYGEVVELGNTSLTMNMEARRHNVYNGSQQTILSTNIKFVKVDEDGTPIPISQKVKDKFELSKKVNEKNESIA